MASLLCKLKKWLCMYLPEAVAMLKCYNVSMNGFSEGVALLFCWLTHVPMHVSAREGGNFEV